MADVFPLLVPQLNVNDETVQLQGWLVEAGTFIRPGDPVCEVETSKAAVEMTAEQEGVIFPTVPADTLVRVGERIGLVGPTLAAIEDFLAQEAAASQQSSRGEADRPVQATARAQELMDQHGITPDEVAATGVVGTIKEADVQRYLSQRPAHQAAQRPGEPTAAIPPSILQRTIQEHHLSRHELAVVRSLRETVRNLLMTTAEVEMDLSVVSERIEQLQKQGKMVSILHVILAALGRALPRYDRMMSFLHDDRVYRYNSVDVAFVVRAMDGRLFTPVIRQVDSLTVEQVSQSCYGAGVRVNRGRISPEELEGGCFTVSHLGAQNVARFVALPNLWQSAILAVGSERRRLGLNDGNLCSTPVVSLTLSYDHSLCDGGYAAEFLNCLAEEMERVLP